MLPSNLKSLIEKYCTGTMPTDEQMDEIMDLTFSLSADSEEVAQYIEEMQNSSVKEDLTYVITLFEVSNTLKAFMTMRALLSWSTADSKEKFADLPIDILTPQDLQEATELLDKLNNGGLVANLTVTNAKGEMVDLSKKEVKETEQECIVDSLDDIESLRKKAEEGDAEAQYKLAMCYDKDAEFCEFTEWIEAAAEQGYAPAQYELGKSLLELGSEVDAFEEFEAAAKQGYAPAQFQLGECYYRGEGVDEDEETAIEWWEKAAEQGDEDAQRMLEFVRTFS